MYIQTIFIVLTLSVLLSQSIETEKIDSLSSSHHELKREINKSDMDSKASIFSLEEDPARKFMNYKKSDSEDNRTSELETYILKKPGCCG